MNEKYTHNGLVAGSSTLLVLGDSIANSIEQIVMRPARDALVSCFDKWDAEYYGLDPITDWDQVRAIVNEAAEKCADGYNARHKFEMAFGSIEGLVDFCMDRLKAECELLKRTRHIRVKERVKALDEVQESIDERRDKVSHERIEAAVENLAEARSQEVI